jgi:HEAT repeat protein
MSKLNFKAPFKLLALIGALAVTSLAHAQSTIEGKHDPLVNWPMMTDPEVKDTPQVKEFDARAIELWNQALTQPDIDTRRQAAQAITRAHRDGFPGLDKTIPALRAIVQTPTNHRFLLINASQALIALNATQATTDLITLNKTGDEDLVLVTDPFLAKTGATEATPLWVKRLKDTQAPRILRESAIRQLGALPSKDAFADLLALACDTSADEGLRLLAARSAVLTRTAQRTEKNAVPLSTGTRVDRIIAVTLLNDVTTDGISQESVALLVKLAQDAEPAVAGEAMELLLKFAPLAVAPIQAKVLANADARVRLLAVKAVNAQASPASIKALAPLLDDVNPDVRRQVRNQFLQQAKNTTLTAAVLANTLDVLNAEGWRGQEQAALILGQLKHKPAIDRLIILIDSPRYEVGIAAVTAVRWIGDHSVAPRLYEIAQRLDKGMPVEAPPAPEPEPAPVEPAKDAKGKPVKAPAKKPAPPKKTKAEEDLEKVIKQTAQTNWLRNKDNIMVQIIHVFKDAQYTASEPLLRKYVPKHSTNFGTSRGAAIWALGHFYADKADADLTRAFGSRATDINPMDPESPLVQRFAVISIGRMKSKSGMGALAGVLKNTNGAGELADAARWAQIQITGKSSPEPEATKSIQSGWFLEPLRDEPKPAPKSDEASAQEPAKDKPVAKEKPAAKPPAAKAPAADKKK